MGFGRLLNDEPALEPLQSRLLRDLLCSAVCGLALIAEQGTKDPADNGTGNKELPEERHGKVEDGSLDPRCKDVDVGGGA